MTGFSTFGFNGEPVENFPLGKIDRACGIPGSFSWTGWAQLVETKPEHGHGEVELRSEGCGQCHIGGGYHPATELMMPVGDVPDEVKEGVDCLICHAKGYDMNQRYVIEDEHGLRWNQDRSLKTAMTVGLPTTDNCLLCHQHNLGGDMEDVPQANAANNTAKAVDEAGSTVETTDNDTEIYADAEGTGSKGRAHEDELLEESLDEEQQADSDEGITNTEDGQRHLDIEA